MTIGYGDMYPLTTSGRIVAIIESIGGLLLTATVIGIINSSIAMSINENNVMELITSYANYDKLKDHSARLIQIAWKLKNG
jgi:voltage-gated potassium channel